VRQDRITHRQRVARGGGKVERLQHMHAGVDFGMVSDRLRHAEKRVDLGQQRGECPATAKRHEKARRSVFHERARQFPPDAFRGQLRQFPAGNDASHQRLGFRSDDEPQPRCEACDAQHAQRVLGKRRAHVPEHARAQIGFTTVGVDKSAVLVARHGVDGKVAPREVGLECDVGRRVEGKSVVSDAALALGTRQRVFLVGLGV
jgi:hypothetical protein